MKRGLPGTRPPPQRPSDSLGRGHSVLIRMNRVVLLAHVRGSSVVCCGEGPLEDFSDEAKAKVREAAHIELMRLRREREGGDDDDV